MRGNLKNGGRGCKPAGSPAPYSIHLAVCPADSGAVDIWRVEVVQVTDKWHPCLPHPWAVPK